MRRSASLLNSTACGPPLVIAALAISLTAGVTQAQTTWFVDDANSPDPDGDGARRLTFLVIMTENSGHQHDEGTSR